MAAHEVTILCIFFVTTSFTGLTSSKCSSLRVRETPFQGVASFDLLMFLILQSCRRVKDFEVAGHFYVCVWVKLCFPRIACVSWCFFFTKLSALPPPEFKCVIPNCNAALCKNIVAVKSHASACDIYQSVQQDRSLLIISKYFRMSFHWSKIPNKILVSLF